MAPRPQNGNSAMSAHDRRRNGRIGGAELEAEFAALSQQVSALETDQRDLKGVVVNLDRKMDAGFASLNQKIDSRNVTPWASIWAALGVLLAGMTAVGWLALQPIQSATGQLRADLSEEYRLRRDEDHNLRRRIDATRSHLDWTNGWLAGRLSNNSNPPGPLNKSTGGK